MMILYKNAICFYINILLIILYMIIIYFILILENIRIIDLILYLKKYNFIIIINISLNVLRRKFNKLKKIKIFLKYIMFTSRIFSLFITNYQRSVPQLLVIAMIFNEILFLPSVNVTCINNVINYNGIMQHNSVLCGIKINFEIDLNMTVTIHSNIIM